MLAHRFEHGSRGALAFNTSGDDVDTSGFEFSDKSSCTARHDTVDILRNERIVANPMASGGITSLFSAVGHTGICRISIR